MNFQAKSSLFTFLLLFGSILNAQTEPVKKENAKRPTPSQTDAKREAKEEILTKELNLSKEQSEQFKKVNKDYKERSNAVKKAKKEELKKLQEERKAAHKALLNEAQIQKYDEAMAKRESQRMEQKKAKKASKSPQGKSKINQGQ